MIIDLLHNGADVNLINSHGLTPLSQAIQNGQTEIVELLIQYGADIDANDDFSLTALSHADSYNRTDIVDILHAHGAQTFTTSPQKLTY